MSPRAFAFGMAASAAVAVAVGLAVLDSPALVRARQLDAQRVRNLLLISLQINVYWTREKRLPPDIEALSRQSTPEPVPLDPETRGAYRYRVTGDRTYELCATFAAENDPDETPGFWSHGAGDHCFALEAEYRLRLYEN